MVALVLIGGLALVALVLRIKAGWASPSSGRLDGPADTEPERAAIGFYSSCLAATSEELLLILIDRCADAAWTSRNHVV